jgi:DinB family protein
MTIVASDDDPVLRLLDAERAALLAIVDRVPSARRTERPAPGRWSVAEILEHISRVDRSVVKMIAVGAAKPLTATPADLARAQFTPKRANAVRERATRVQAPEPVHPIGGQSIESALEQLASARGSLKAAYLAASPTVLDGAVQPHPFLGPMTLRGWVEFTAHHDARHARQIAEIADAADARLTAGR